MKKITFINGSPRGKNSASQYYIDELRRFIGDGWGINEDRVYGSVNYEAAANSDIIVLAFPLYVDCLPAPMIEFLTNLEEWHRGVVSSPRVYAVINCGFFEGAQNKHAVQIIKNFCKKAGYVWRFGIGIGAGGFMSQTKDFIPFDSEVKRAVYDAVMEIVSDIRNNDNSEKHSLFVSPGFPTEVYLEEGNKGWIEVSKQVGVSEEDLYARPFDGNS